MTLTKNMWKFYEYRSFVHFFFFNLIPSKRVVKYLVFQTIYISNMVKKVLIVNQFFVMALL